MGHVDMDMRLCLAHLALLLKLHLGAIYGSLNRQLAWWKSLKLVSPCNETIWIEFLTFAEKALLSWVALDRPVTFLGLEIIFHSVSVDPKFDFLGGRPRCWRCILWGLSLFVSSSSSSHVNLLAARNPAFNFLDDLVCVRFVYRNAQRSGTLRLLLRIVSFVFEIEAVLVSSLSHWVLSLSNILSSFVALATLRSQARATSMTAFLVFELFVCKKRFAFGMSFWNEALPRLLCSVYQLALADVVGLSMLLTSVPAHVLHPLMVIFYISPTQLAPVWRHL